MLPFWGSIAVLSIAQGVTTALPGVGAAGSVQRMRLVGRLSGRWWAILPPASIAVFVAVGAFAASASATVLTYLALVGVPIGAALALGWLARGARPAAALAVAPLFALAWADQGGLAGQAAAMALTGLSCVALGAVLSAVTPWRWLAVGIVAMALIDTTMVVSELLQQPNAVLNATHPAAGLPRLQAELFGSAAMGYGDLFVAGLLGGVLATTGSSLRQWRGALLVVLVAWAFDLLFFAVNELPATVPVALTLIVVLVADRLGGRRAREPSEGRRPGVTGGSLAG